MKICRGRIMRSDIYHWAAKLVDNNCASVDVILAVTKQLSYSDDLWLIKLLSVRYIPNQINVDPHLII